MDEWALLAEEQPPTHSTDGAYKFGQQSTEEEDPRDVDAVEIRL